MAHPVSNDAHAAHGHDAHGHHGAHEHHGSWMPIIITVGATLLLMGAVWPMLAIPGILVMLGAVVGWVREDVHENRNAPFTLPGRHSEYFWGTIVLILSELVIFGVLFFFYYWSRAHADVWPAEQIAHLDLSVIVINTVLLLSSGATVHMAQHSLHKGDIRKFQLWLGITVVLGALFLGGQVYEYYHLVHDGLTPKSGPYGTAFYSLTGTHGLHVLAGVGVLAAILGLSFTGFITKERYSGVTGAFLYWHFVDVVWIFVVSIVYLRLI
jgi:cytochrome c oxidase subunit 3